MSSPQPIEVRWIDHEREPKQPPNVRFPQGRDIDLTNGARVACIRDLEYPAKRCGVYVVTCRACGFSAVISTAGRVDDPRSVKMPCKKGDLQ